ncbi:MAG: hypothetical protein CBC42_07380 [Betaproteobacteria bacterium TMED82]|nr:MAG: hypothetical protein CBC42_07380 [Betaproteobacteria bacterium TMED82]|tara:strand:- start:1597 stop:2655 length:1059 start_codon:yes stop_codon:yes gene_type:complete
MKKGLFFVIVLVLLSLSTSVILIGEKLFSKHSPIEKNKNVFKVNVKVDQVKQKPVKEVLFLTGEFRANESVLIRSEVSGKITNLYFSDGMQVSKGQILIELEKSIPLAELMKAEAEFTQTLDNLRRSKELNAQNFLSSRALNDAEALFNIALAKKKLREATLALYSIKAPFAGMTGLRNVSVGDFIDIGQEILLIEDLSKLKFDFRLPEKYINLIKIGQEIEISTEATEEPITAEVEAFDVRIEKNGRFLVARSFIPNSISAFKSGMFGKVKLTLEKKENGLVISEQAIFSEQSRKYVWKVNEGKVEKVLVKTGVRLGDEVEIIDGVGSGDSLVTEGQLKIRKSGQEVSIVE